MKTEQTQERILHQAAQLFNRKGYAATCIRDIMEATGLAKGGIYGNFRSKEEIQIAAFEYALGLVTAALNDALEGHEGAIAKLHALLRFHERYIVDPPIEGGCVVLNAAVEADDASPLLRGYVVKALDGWGRRIRAIVRAGMRSGEIHADADPEEFAQFFIATVEGGVMLAKAYGDVKRFRQATRPLERYIDNELKAA